MSSVNIGILVGVVVAGGAIAFVVHREKTRVARKRAQAVKAMQRALARQRAGQVVGGAGKVSLSGMQQLGVFLPGVKPQAGGVLIGQFKK